MDEIITISQYKPILKWAGGKRWLVPMLSEIWKPYNQTRLVEPFAGGLAIALGLNPTKALLNDANEHLINFYQQIKKGLTISHHFKNEADVYYKLRAKFNRLILKNQFFTKEAASIFYFLIRTGYNGLCRFNRRGEFNVPFGQHQKINYKTDFVEYKKIFKTWDLCYGDFQAIALKKTDFIYADPPYDVDFTQYHRQGFVWQDQERLAHWLADHKGPVVASNQATKRIVKLYQSLGFKVFTLPAPRFIACNGNRQKAIEMLALRNLPCP